MNEYESCCSKEDDECPICMENFELVNTALTDCGHTFCIKCFIILYSNSNNKCPICRQQMYIDAPVIHHHHHNHAPHNHTNCFQRIYNYWFKRNSTVHPTVENVPLRRGIVLGFFNSYTGGGYDAPNRGNFYTPWNDYIVPINRPHYQYNLYPNNRRIIPL